MPALKRPDGVEIHWEQSGEGETVVITPHAWGVPDLYEPLIRELERDRRVIRYDARGTGRSSRRGPHDMDTGAADLVALVEEAGRPAAIVGIADAPNRAVRAAAERPDLIPAVVSIASAPIGMSEFRDTEALVGSSTVLDAFIDQMATDYRGAMRPLLRVANPQASDQEIRDRIDTQVAYVPQDAIVARVRAWKEDDPSAAGVALGDRLWLLASPDTAGPWFPPPEIVETVVRRKLPDAHRLEIEDGIVSRPELTAEVVRRVTIPARAR